MILGTDGKPIIAPQNGEVFIVKGFGQTRKTYLMKDGKPIDLSNRHMRRSWMKQQLTDWSKRSEFTK